MLSWALIPELSRAQTNGLCNQQGSGFVSWSCCNGGYHCHFTLVESRQGQGTSKWKAGVGITCLTWGEVTRKPQARMPCVFIACLLCIDRAFVVVSPHLQERKWEDVRLGRGCGQGQPLVFETTSPRNKVTRTPSLIRFTLQIFPRHLPWDRRHWGPGVPPL